VVGAVLLDLYGVLVDADLTRRQYRHLVVAHFVDRYGGDTARWDAAYAAAYERYLRKVSLPGFWRDQPYAEAMRESEAGFLEDLFREVLKPPPEGDLLAYSQALDTAIFVEIDAAFPEVRETLVALRALGVEILVATGAHLPQARAALRGSGLTGIHGLLTSDLLGARKDSLEFWRGAFSAVRRNPWDCAVVDDSPGKLEPAARLGAQAILVSREGGRPHVPFTLAGSLENLRALPELVRRLP